MKGQSLCLEDRQQTQTTALPASEDRFRLVFEHAPIGMVISDLKGRFVCVNQAMADIVGYPVEQLVGMDFASITDAEDLVKDIFLVRELLHGNKSRVLMEKRYLRSDGETIFVTLHIALVRDARRRPRYFIIQIIDTTEHKRYEQTIKHLAYHDPLTGLPNRVMLRDKLAVALAQARVSQDMLAVVFLDLDRFKVINDTLGHYIGDQALKFIADRLVASVRNRDIVARLSGDEFTVILPGISGEQDVFKVLHKLMDALQQPMRLEDREFSVSASVGIALYPRDGQESEELLQTADKAMYVSKQRKGIGV